MTIRYYRGGPFIHYSLCKPGAIEPESIGLLLDYMIQLLIDVLQRVSHPDDSLLGSHVQLIILICFLPSCLCTWHIYHLFVITSSAWDTPPGTAQPAVRLSL